MGIFSMAHITLIDLNKDLPMPILPFFTFPLRCILKQSIWLSTCTLISVFLVTVCLKRNLKKKLEFQLILTYQNT